MIGFQLGALTYSDFINEDAELAVLSCLLFKQIAGLFLFY